jgi:molybdopterin synthase catalytic subunit
VEVKKMLEIYDRPLPGDDIIIRWLNSQHSKNYGAFIPFFGIVRGEDNIEALSFDIYEPLLISWFNSWQEKAKAQDALLLMAHSKNRVPLHKVSFMCGIFSKGRRVALDMIDDFVEDFKKNAPIWKYDIINGEKIYAKNRSVPLVGSGILKTILE